MWLFAMFDLPVDKPELRREYTRFRKALLREGFTMLQYSVYAHYVASAESEEVYRRKVAAALPSHGQVRLVSVTDRQFEKMEVYVGKNEKKWRIHPTNSCFFDGQKAGILPEVSNFGEDQVYPSRGSRQTLAQVS